MKRRHLLGAPIGENREAGLSPARSRHCKVELGPLTTIGIILMGRGCQALKLSQETCLKIKYTLDDGKVHSANAVGFFDFKK
ncbi:MAG: hypothetical protein VR72_17555 [Clostridiaceae bacterium BRH_c20a]|nr:MAG: hypothetical protein VR72_17555 [Clostridiaceae bacterium BRH_c20a]